MKIDIVGIPEYYLFFEEAHLAYVLELSKMHYDGVCRAASARAGTNGATMNGFLTVWSDNIESQRTHEPDSPTRPCRSSRHELDTLLKILEIRGYDSSEDNRAFGANLARSLCGARDAASTLREGWQASYDGTRLGS
ncbi:hypothetical protein [Burkholderia cenocepacia]|uniref:hypothetical protein n=1 Tax=Burkholderia cenocepacia TaxID=95486 RepID=UPI00076CDE5B|nr:hypothetical protein [Burkholderia cenocepacia]KWU17892.1 hypothetical protein AS149_14550 [Burkholderia cenocepacia]